MFGLKAKLKKFVLTTIEEWHIQNNTTEKHLPDIYTLDEHKINVMYVDVGRLPKSKAERFMCEVAESFLKFKEKQGFQKNQFPVMFMARMR